ncbi:MAG: A/G-specific adenine glycosylase [Alphaproteobacteria bacterium]|nr:A/G-specific adenine glycosylase [Alphaproteobacteria bacterium]
MITESVLAWYDQNRRSFLWRAKSGELPDFYHVWLSEIMLQQTNTTTVTPYFQRFIERWPTLQDLASAELDDILHAWQGLGYYSRARSLYKAAQALSCAAPKTEAELLKIPGIGPYTAGAIAAIVYDLPSQPVDGNIARIYARLNELGETKPSLYKKVQQILARDTPLRRNGDFVQALMDIGATICLPKKPLCSLCPVQSYCQSYQNQTQLSFPMKIEKPRLPHLHAYVYWLENPLGQVLIRKRPETGLLAGLYEFPSSEWRESEVLTHIDLPFPAAFADVVHGINHTFTHFHLTLQIVPGRVCESDLMGLWVHPQDFHKYAFPSLMKKIMTAIKRL